MQKHRWMKILAVGMVMLAQMMMVVGPAMADLLAYEPFSGYAVNTLLDGKNRGVGFDSAWDYQREIGSGTPRNGGHKLKVRNGSVSFGRLVTAGDKLEAETENETGVDTSVGLQEAATRSLDVALDPGEDVWMSYLTAIEAGTSPDQTHGLAILDGSDTAQHAVDTSAAMVAFSPYIVISKWSAADGSGKVWMLDEGDFAPVTTSNSADLTEAMLDSLVAPTLLGSTTFGDLSTLQIDLRDWTDVVADGSDHLLYIDELRIGTTLLDVTPLVPEPSSLVIALLGLLGSGLLWRRRRRAK